MYLTLNIIFSVVENYAKKTSVVFSLLFFYHLELQLLNHYICHYRCCFFILQPQFKMFWTCNTLLERYFPYLFNIWATPNMWISVVHIIHHRRIHNNSLVENYAEKKSQLFFHCGFCWPPWSTVVKSLRILLFSFCNYNFKYLGRVIHCWKGTFKTLFSIWATPNIWISVVHIIYHQPIYNNSLVENFAKKKCNRFAIAVFLITLICNC